MISVRLVVPTVDGVANVVHQADHELHVVDGAQGAGQELVGLEQVVDVGTGVVLRDVAAELLVDSGEVALEAGGGEVHTAVEGIDAAAAAQAGGRHAVEGIGAGLNRGEEIVGLRDAQQVTRLGSGQLVADPTDDGAQVFLL